jgi:hypothetical protein
MADQTFAGLDDAVGAVLHDQRQSTAGQVRNNIITATGTNPDQEASYKHLAAFMNVPTDTVRADPKAIQQQANAQRVNADALATDFPHTAAFLTDTDNARIVHDDVPATSAVEQGVKMLPPPPPAAQAPSFGDIAGNLGMAAVQGLGGAFNKAAGSAGMVVGGAASIYDKVASLISGRPVSAAGDFAFKHFVDPNLANAPAFELRQGASFGEKATSAATNLLGMLSQITLSGTAGEAPAAASSVPAMLTGAVEHGTKAMLFPALSDAIDTGRKVYQQTGDAGAAIRAATAQYGTSTAGGIVPLGASGNLATRLVSGAASGVATGELSHQIMNAAMPSTMQAPELTGEDRVLNALTGSILSGVMGGRAEPRFHDAVREFGTQAASADAAATVGKTIEALGQVSAASKLRERDPQAFHEFVQNVTEDGHMSDVWIDAKTLDTALAQSGVTPAELAAKMPDVLAQLHEAVQTNGDVRIPVADYATHIAGGPVDQAILPHLKAEPEGMTYSEGQAYQAEQAKHMQDAADQIVKGKVADDVRQAQSQQIYEHILEQLTKANRFRPDVNQAYAAMTRDFYATQAERAGVTPAEMLQRYPLRIGAERIAGESALAQNGDHGTSDGRPDGGSAGSELRGNEDALPTVGGGRAAQGWAGATRAGREGRPVVVYRGAKLPLAAEHFGPDSLGKASGNPSSGLGVWFTPDQAEAGRYGTAEKFHLDIRNPKAIKVDELPAFESVAEANAFREKLRAEGYDGIAVIAKHLGGTNHLVAFDPHQVIYPKSRAGEFKQGERGLFDPHSKTIALLKGADLSTYLHESGHFFLDTLADMASRPDAPEAVKQDMQTLLDHFGVKDLDTWNKMTVDQQREAHETFARGFERYLMEGKAPSVELQGLFARFRSWLVNVYKSLTALNVELTPQVRGVMDRLLATDEAIKQAEQVRGYAPLFESAEAAGMTPEDYASYQRLGVQATENATTELEVRSMRDMRWLANAKEKMVKGLNKGAVEARKAIEAEVKAEVNATPVEQARRFFKYGELDEQPRTNKERKALDKTAGGSTKLDIDALKEMYGDGPAAQWRYLERGKNGIAGEHGLDPDIAAELFGFHDGRELVQALLDSNPKELIEGMTDQRMLERHGELTDAASIERLAEAAIHNEARARFVATELKALAKATGPARALAEAAKQAADSAIAAKRVRDLRPAQYTAAEARAAKNAEKALRGGDVTAAAVEKRAQLLNNRLAKTAADAVTEVQKAVAYLKKFDKPSIREKIELEYRDQIDALLDRFDLRTSTTATELNKREALLAFVERMSAAGYEPQVPEKLLDEAQRQHYKDMKVEDFRGLVDAVKSIEHLGRLKQTLLDGKEAREIADVAQEVKDTTAKLPQHEADSNRGLSFMESKWLSAKAAGRSMTAALLKMEQMMDWLDARNPNGPLNRVVFRRIADAGVREYDLQAKVKGELDKLLDSHLQDVTKEKGKVYVADGLIDGLTGKPQRFTKKEMLALAGNMGNDSNLSKLAAGEKWDPAQIWAFLHKNMTKADWDFVAGLGRTLEGLWPEKLAMSRRLGNTNPEKIEPRPFDTPHGRYDGWYWPMIYDPARAQDVAERGAKSADALFENIYSRANTDTGRTNTRNENYARPVLLSLDVIPRVIKDEIHDIAYREAIIDADKVLRDPTVRKSIISALSQEHYDQLRPWLQSIANDRKVDMQALKWFDRVAHGARTRATIVGLGYRISTMLVHGSSAAMESIAELGPKWMAKGIADFANPAQWAANRDFIFERSGEMRNRMNEVDRDVREHIREIDLRLMDSTTGAVTRGVDTIKAHAYQGIAMLDMASALPTWMGAYHKGMAPKSEGGLGLSEQDAVYNADKVVRNAHGGTGIKDLAAVQRGPEFFKLFTMFYTFWNHNVNRLMDTARRAKELPESFRSGEPGKFSGDLATVALRTLVYTLGVQAMHSMLHPSKDDETGEANWLAWAAKEFTAAAFAGVPILRDVAAHYLTGKDYSATPAASMVEAIGQSGKDAMDLMAGKETSDKWLKHLVNTAGYVFGLPLGQGSSAAQFLWDVAAGKQNPETAGDWLRGVMHGTMKH